MSELAVIFYKTVKHNSRCLICGTNHGLQFHHVTPAMKISEVYKIASANELGPTIAELNKTVPLCDADHRRVHRGHQPGWLNGNYDNGGRSHARIANEYLPYLNYLARRKPEIFMAFYRDYIERAHDAVWPFMGLVSNVADRPNPSVRLSLVK